jgi:hypothetical protein
MDTRNGTTRDNTIRDEAERLELPPLKVKPPRTLNVTCETRPSLGLTGLSSQRLADPRMTVGFPGTSGKKSDATTPEDILRIWFNEAQDASLFINIMEQITASAFANPQVVKLPQPLGAPKGK